MSSPQVRVVQLPAAAILALAAGDLDTANEAAADLTPPLTLTPWLVSPESRSTWAFRARQAVESPVDLDWMTGALQDAATGAVVGKAGFHAAPDADGMVELGYAVDPACRRKGYARAALELLLARARSEPGVRVLRATVSPDNTPSLGLLARYPFVEVGEQWDEEDGLETVYELRV